LNRQDSELNCLATAFRLQPSLGSADDHFKLARSLEEANNREGAVLFYQQAVEQDPERVAAYQRLADLLEEGGDWQGAAECYRKVLMLNAEAEKREAEKASAKKLPLKLSPEGQQQMKQLLAASKTKKLLVKPEGNGAISETNAALSISPAEAATLSPTELARRYAATQDWDRAIEQMQRAIAQEPQSAILYRSLAKLFEQKGEAAASAEAWYQSFVLDPNWPDAQQCFALGRVLTRHNKVEAATRCYQHAVRLQPEFLPAREALNALQKSGDGKSLLREMLPSSEMSQGTGTVKK
ncbi:MAG: tetratricopeptide repeat protein, partial [Cyanobacteria bacterium J06576_12]